MIQWERMAIGNKMFPGKIHRECIATRWLKGFGQRRGELPLHLPHPRVTGVPAGCPTRDAGVVDEGGRFGRCGRAAVSGQPSAVSGVAGPPARGAPPGLPDGMGGGATRRSPSALGGTGMVRYPEPDQCVSDGGVGDDDAAGEQLGPAPAVGIRRRIGAAVVAVRPRHHAHRNGCSGGGRPGCRHPDHQGLRGVGGRGMFGPPPKGRFPAPAHLPRPAIGALPLLGTRRKGPCPDNGRGSAGRKAEGVRDQGRQRGVGRH
jgi:hypothetical protein